MRCPYFGGLLDCLLQVVPGAILLNCEDSSMSDEQFERFLYLHILNTIATGLAAMTSIAALAVALVALTN